MMATMMYVAHGDPTFSFAAYEARQLSPTQRHKSQPAAVLPAEAAALKSLIRKAHPSKCFSFSLLHMRKVASPPVQIPAMYRCSTATKTMVSGHQVPFTREMWMRRLRLHPHRMEGIEEEASMDRRK